MSLQNKVAYEKKRDDALLWEAICRGDRSAFDNLFRRFYHSLFYYGIKVIAEEEQVKDAIQELFFRLWKQRHSLSQAQNVEVYLLHSLRRILLRDIENQKIRSERHLKYLNEFFDATFTMEEVITSHELDNERKEKLLNAVNHLNSRQKETLFLRYYHGLSNSEIAGVMNINPQSVRNHLSRAILSLKSIIQAEPLHR